jgi:hypothetical protein
VETRYYYVAVPYEGLNAFLTFCRCIPNLRSSPPVVNTDFKLIEWFVGAPGLKAIIEAFCIAGDFQASWVPDTNMRAELGDDYEERMGAGLQFAW